MLSQLKAVEIILNVMFMGISIISLTVLKAGFLLSAELEELIEPNATSRFLAVCFSRDRVPDAEMARQLDKDNITASTRGVDLIQLPESVMAELQIYANTKGRP